VHASEQDKHYAGGQINITTFSYTVIYKVFSKIMIEEQEVMRISHSPTFC
jgi:hypothetical protein